jgi:hypothetical protein
MLFEFRGRLTTGECRGVLLRKEWGLGNVPQFLKSPKTGGLRRLKKD